MLTYLDLIDDHEHIERCATLMLHELNKPHARPNRLVEQMHDLASFVRDHIAAEQRIVATCDANPLPSPWRAAWITGRDNFAFLCADWQAFLDDWDVETITCDPQGFHLAACEVLGRLRERLELETKGLYAVALQTGAIRFKATG